MTLLKLLLKHAPLVGFLILLTGCNRDNAESGGISAATAEQAEDSAESTKITVFGWEGFVSPDAIARFTEETGIEVEYVEFEGYDECRAGLESSPGKYDVTIAETGGVSEWAELMLIRPLDHSKLSLLSNIDPRYLNLDTDPGNRYSAPLSRGTTIIAYRSDLITPKKESWEFLWDPAAKGRVALLDDPREAFAVGFLRNGASVNTSDEADFKAAEATLRSLLEENETRFGEAYRLLDSLAAGELWITQAWSGDAALYAADDENIATINPVEGGTQYLDNWVIARASEHPDEAHAFINFMLRPESAAATSNFSRYATPIQAALPFLDEDLRQDTLVYPPAEFLARCEMFDPLNSEREARLQLGMRNLIMARPESAPKILPVSGEQAPPQE